MGTVSDQIDAFTETYSTIVIGMHKEIEKYRKEVNFLKENIGKSDKIDRLYDDILASSEYIEKMEERLNHNFYSLQNLNIEVSSTRTQLESLKSSLQMEQKRSTDLEAKLASANSRIQELTISIKSLNSSQDRISGHVETQKFLIFGCFFLVVFILVLTLIL